MKLSDFHVVSSRNPINYKDSEVKSVRNIFLIIMIILNIIVISITLVNHVQIDNLSLRVFFTAFSIVIAVYLVLLRKSRVDMWLAIILFLIALTYAIMIANAVYHYVY